MPEASLAQRILEAVAPHTGPVVFGLPGVHNLAFWTPEAPGLPRIVVPRHEQTTVYAADGYARRTGRIGVALTTTGPGAANAVAAFGEAAASGSPVLLVASEVPTAMQGKRSLHAMPATTSEQSALFAPLTDLAFSVSDVGEALRAVQLALTGMLTRPRPAYVGVASDVLAHAAPAVPALEPDPTTAVPVDAAAAALDGAERIVIWAGGGARGAAHEVAELATRLGAPVVTTYSARGLVPTDHPAYVGVPPHEQRIAQLVADADLLLVLGSDLDGMTTRNWSMPRPPVLVRVDVDQARLEIPWPADVAVHGPVAGVATELARAVRREPRPLPDLAGARAATRCELADDPRTAEAVELVRSVEAAITATDAAVVCDMAVAGYWVGGYAEVGTPRRVLYPVGWGTLGFALPAAVGAAVGGTPALAVCGDAGVLFAIGELATIAQERLPVVVLVVDDGGYGMLRFDQDRAGHARRGVDLLAPDFVALAESFGIAGHRVNGVGAPLRSALESSLGSGAPAVVVVEAALVPPRTTSPRWRD